MAVVAIVCGAGIVSGKEIMALELGIGLRKQGDSIVYVTSRWGNGEFARRLHSMGFPFFPMRLGFISATLRPDSLLMTADQIMHWPKLVFDYFRFVLREKPVRVVHTNWHHALLLWLFFKPHRDLYWLHETVPDSPHMHRVFRIMASRMNCFIAVSNAVASSLRNAGVPDHQIRVVHNGLIDPVPNTGVLSLKEIRPDGEISIGIVGQVGYWKGHEDLLEAISFLVPKYPNIRLHIFGDDKSPYAELLKERALDLGILEFTMWHGFVCDRSQIYSVLDICVVPSRFDEPFGLTALEPMFFGLPVVAARKGGLSEIVEDGHTGFLVPAEEPMALASRLVELIVDPSLRWQMGSAGRTRAQQHFGHGNFIRKFENILQNRQRGVH